MQKNKFYHYAIKTIGTISIIGLFFGGWNFAQVIDTTTLVNGIDALDKSTDKENFDEMISYFCDAIANKKDGIYNSSQSLFAYFICKYKNKTDSFSNRQILENAQNSYIKFTENNEGEKVNALEKDLPGFYYDTEEYIKTLFDDIVGSYMSIYQANIYGYANIPDRTPEEIIHTVFANKYLGKGDGKYIELCSTDNDKEYHPKTCKKLKEYFYGAKNLINGNSENYLNDENIYKKLPKDNKGIITCSTTLSDNMIPCGLYGGKITYFTNLVYNELMYYALFMDYYSYLLQNKSDFKNRDIRDFEAKLRKNQSRVNTMLSDIEQSRKAIQTSIKMLKELQYSFPIHIGFLMYMEDLYKFTSTINKTLTPISTLYDIMRNVQNPN